MSRSINPAVSADEDSAPGGRRPRSQDMDRHVGRRIRMQRVLVGLTLQQLAAAVGVTHQQIHKYELGNSRISVGRLYQVAAVLGVEVGYFFQTTDGKDNVLQAGHDRQFLEMAKSYQLLTPNQQQAINLIARALAG